MAIYIGRIKGFSMQIYDAQFWEILLNFAWPKFSAWGLDCNPSCNPRQTHLFSAIYFRRPIAPFITIPSPVSYLVLVGVIFYDPSDPSQRIYGTKKYTVDGSENILHHLGWDWNLVNNGISTTNLNWWVYRISEPSTVLTYKLIP